jgi:hypothetical protein
LQQNEHVLRIKYGPGEKSPMNSHPESISVFLTDAHAKFTYPDGRTEEIKANAGTVQHMDAFTHQPENLSSSTPLSVECKALHTQMQKCAVFFRNPEHLQITGYASFVLA